MALLLAINQLIRRPDSKIASFLFASRKEYDIENEFSKHRVCRVCIETDEVAANVKLYVIQELEKDERLRRLKPGLKDHIITTLISRAQGMYDFSGIANGRLPADRRKIRFRWVKCQLDTIRTAKTPKATRQALLSLSEGLDESYERILVNTPEDAVLLHRALQLIAFALRPVTPVEADEAVTTAVGEHYLHEEARLHEPALLLAICGSLVSMDGPHLGLAHYSVQEFLKSERIQHGPARGFAMTSANAAYEISEICLTYLGFVNLNKGPCSPKDLMLRKQSFRFSRTRQSTGSDLQGWNRWSKEFSAS